ncbi:MAG: DUF126 domain-containing protein [Elusimicrobiota bacterium]
MSVATKKLTGRAIFEGAGAGTVLKSDVPMGFFGHIDPETGIYRETGHPLDGKLLAGRVLVFPSAKGSTVGSYVIYALRKTGKAPAAMILRECDTIVAVGAIIGEVPTIDNVDISKLANNAKVRVKGSEVSIEEG